jgi:predicted small secreted protein
MRRNRYIISILKQKLIFEPEALQQWSQCWQATGMNARELGVIFLLLAAMPNLAGCETSQGQDYQFQKQVQRAQECRQLQDKLVGDQPLTPERGEKITHTMNENGCTARLP